MKRRLGLPLELVSLPWARVQAYVRDRKVDGLITVPIRERLQYLAASKNVFSLLLSVYINGDSPYYAALGEVTNLQALAPFEGCEIYGNNSAIERYQRFRFDKIQLVTKYRQCFQMLLANRVDFVITPSALVAGLIKDMDKGAALRKQPFKIPANHYLMIHKKSPYMDVLPKFNRVIREMRQEGVIGSIVKKHGMTYNGQ